MRVVKSLVVAVFAASTLVALTPATAHAAAPVTGRLRDGTSNQVLAGERVLLRRNDGGVPGELVDSAITNAVGDYSLTPDVAGVRYFVQLVAGDYQNGFLRAGDSWFYPLGEGAQLWDPGTDVGATFAEPAFARGAVVSSTSGRAVSGVLVALRNPVTHDLIESDVTNVHGRYYLGGLTQDEYDVKLSGPSGYETGFLACYGQVVPTWGDACSHGPGRLVRARLDPV